MSDTTIEKIIIARKICNALKMLYVKNLITSLGGNISVRIGDRVLITPSSFGAVPKFKYEVEPEDLVEVDLQGNTIKGGKPSSEIHMHLDIYRNCDSCKAVVHVHGVWAPMITERDLDDLFLDTETLYVLKPKICIVDVEKPGSMELAKAVAEKAKEGCQIIYLMKHGIVAVSNNLALSIELAELGEAIAARTVMKRAMSNAFR